MNNYLPIVFLGVDGDIALGGTQASKASCMPNLRYCLTSFPTSKGEALLNQCNVDVAGTSVIFNCQSGTNHLMSLVHRYSTNPS